MSFSDELFDKQFYLARAIMNCNDPIEIKKLFDEYILYAGQWDALFSTRKATNRLEAIHFVFSFFLELSGIADEAVAQGVRTPPTIESVARVLRLFPPLRKYCEDHFLNDGIIGALKYGESYAIGHDLVVPALKLLESELLSGSPPSEDK